MGKKQSSRAPIRQQAATKSRSKQSRRGLVATGKANAEPIVIYIHGIGRQEPEQDLKRTWDLALFGKEMGDRTRMAYWSDILHGGQRSTRSTANARMPAIDIPRALRDMGLKAKDPQAIALAESLVESVALGD